MCQRRQKAWSDVAAYGESKFCGKVKPRSSAIPIAMSV